MISAQRYITISTALPTSSGTPRCAALNPDFCRIKIVSCGSCVSKNRVACGAHTGLSITDWQVVCVGRQLISLTLMHHGHICISSGPSSGPALVDVSPTYPVVRGRSEYSSRLQSRWDHNLWMCTPLLLSALDSNTSIMLVDVSNTRHTGLFYYPGDWFASDDT